MKTKIESHNNVDAVYETSTFALGVGLVAAALVGIWGVTCLVSALFSNGPVNLVKGYISTIIG